MNQGDETHLEGEEPSAAEGSAAPATNAEKKKSYWAQVKAKKAAKQAAAAAANAPPTAKPHVPEAVAAIAPASAVAPVAVAASQPPPKQQKLKSDPISRISQQKPPAASSVAPRDADASGTLYRAGPRSSAAASPPSSSPVLAAASGSPARSALDPTAKAAQAASLFSLLSAHQTAGKPTSTAATHAATARGTGKKQQPFAKSQQGGAAGVGTEPAAAGGGGLDLLALINRSHEQQRKQRQQETHEPSDTARAPKSEPAATPTRTNSSAAAVASSVASTPAEKFGALYAQSKVDDSKLSALLGQQGKYSFTDDSRAQIVSLRSSLRTRYLELITEFTPRFALQKGLIHKLWMLRYREMEATLNQCKAKAATRPATSRAAAGFDLFAASAAEEEEALSGRLQGMIDTNFELFDGLSAGINARYSVFGTDAASSDKPHSAESVHAAKQLLSSLCVCLGDLERYRQQYLSATADYTRCTFFYTRSLLLDPTSSSAGRSHNQMAVVIATGAGPDGHKACAMFESLYQYTRALSTVTNPFPARENVLQLYETNRVSAAAILRQIASHTASFASDLSILFCLFVHLIAIRDTSIGVESFDVALRILNDKLKAVLNEDWFTGAAAGASQRAFTDKHAISMLLLVLNMTEQNLSKDAAAAATNGNGVGGSANTRPRNAAVLAGLGKSSSSANSATANSSAAGAVEAVLTAAPSVTPTSPFPFPLSHHSRACLAIVYDLLGILVRIPTLISKGSDPLAFYSESHLPLPFLAPLSFALGWIRAKWPWILTQPQQLHDEVSGVIHPCEYVRTGLAQLANLLVPMVASDAATTIPPSAVSLLELEGFKPLVDCGFWPVDKAAMSADSFGSQARAIVDFARAILHVHPATGRFSALPPPPSALSAVELEHLKLQQELWAKQQANRLNAVAQPPRKKRASKQAKPRPLMAEASASTSVTETETNAPEDEEESSSQSQDAEEQVIARIKEIELQESVEAELEVGQLDRRAPQTSALESMVSDSNLGLTPAASSTSPLITPAKAAASASIPSSLSLGSSKPLLVLDAPNIACTHGRHQMFSVRGVELVMEYWSRRGFRVLAFAPASCLDYEAVGAKRRAIKAGLEGVKITSIPDNIALLNAWRKEGRLVATPPQDYDDTYLIDYAMQNSNALIISNDQYRDHAEFHGGGSTAARAHLRQWLKEHVISYAFVGDEFRPNPDWKADPHVGLRKLVKPHHPPHHHHAAHHAYPR